MVDLTIGTDTSAKDILQEGALTEYEQGITFLYFELLELNVNVFLIEKIFEFPLKLFFLEERAGKEIFLSQFVDNAMHMSILSITRLIADDSSDVFTINAFQNKLLQLAKPEYQSSFKKRLKDNRFSDPEIRNTHQKAKEFRNKRIAHLTIDYYRHVYDNTIEIAKIYFPDVKALCEKLNRSFNNLSFAREYFLLPDEYWDDLSPIYKPDIEEILDSIAKNSHILNLRETSPQRWQIVLPTLTQDDLSHLNQYRKKFGMSEIQTR